MKNYAEQYIHGHDAWAYGTECVILRLPSRKEIEMTPGDARILASRLRRAADEAEAAGEPGSHCISYGPIQAVPLDAAREIAQRLGEAANYITDYEDTSA